MRCGQCGMTSRQLVVRVSEHFDPTKHSAVQDHVATCHHCCDGNPLDRFEVLRGCRTSIETACTEAFYIKKKRPHLNKQLVSTMGCQFLIKICK